MTEMPAGARFGAYEILSPLGAGGMGEVYKASDTRLDRVVALKVLPRHWAQDSEMKQRFEREARIIASLNHPNICVLHDIGQQDGRDFLVMEYLEGETLAARLEKGPIPWQEAAKFALRMADALDKAHRKGVVHRDLKPSNIILTSSGPKLLDFGLAKWTMPGGPSSTSASQAATLTNVTVPGAIIGTLQYMAPEQLEGIEADARTDIFAFGTVLHEMVTGKKTFEGKSRVMLMAAIAATEPARLTESQPAIPAALDHVVSVCLAKDPNDRWQTARDVYAELEWAARAGSETGLAGASMGKSRHQGKSSWIPQVVLALAVVLVAAAAYPAALYLRGPRPAEEFRVRVPITISARPDETTGNNARTESGSNFAVSPDGRRMVYLNRASTSDPFMLFLRPVDSVTPQKLAGTEDAQQPFWSGDGRFIGFIVGGKMKKVEVTGGPAQDICDVPGFSGATWNRDGVILFGSPAGVLRVSGEGGKPEALTTLEPGEAGHYWPHFLPDGRHFLYTSWNEEATRRAVIVGVLGSKERTKLTAAESNAGYGEPVSGHGYLLFYRGNAVYARPFDAKKLTVTGEEVRVADEVTATTGRGNYAVSPNGVLVYFSGVANGGNNAGASSAMSEWQLTWMDRTARVVDSPGPVGAYRGWEVSPDGKRIAAHRHDAKGGDIVVIEPRGSTTKLTFDAAHHNSSPVWSPKGDRIAYSALEKGKWGIYQVLSSGSGTEELLYESEALKAPMSWSPDGKRIVFWVQDPKNGGDLWSLTVDSDKGDKKEAAPLIASPANETHGQISPDGKWIAYTSDSTGRNEVYIQPFPSGSGHWQVSFHGGDWPRWNGNSKELFFHAIANTVDTPATTGAFPNGLFFTVGLTVNGGAMEPGSPKELLRVGALNIPHTGGDYSSYAVSSNGQQILYPQYAPGGSTGTASIGAISPDPQRDFTVAMHWAK